MSALNRNNTAPIATWFRNSDRLTLFCALLLLFIGYIMVMAASPAVALRIGANYTTFIIKQVVFLLFATLLLFIFASLSRKIILVIGALGSITALGLVFYALLYGTEIKGARRWISVWFFSFQPSEFLKPCFAVLTGYLLTQSNPSRKLACFLANWVMWGLILILLKIQPDVGMLTVITAVFVCQNFIAGMRLKIFGTVCAGLVAIGAWILLTSHHARVRMQEFWSGTNSEHYQIDMALRAFGHGGLVGQGLGEGKVKNFIPDAHADFVFSVVGEEGGALFCLLIIALYILIIYSTLKRLKEINDPFVIVATSGLVTGFGLQACINMASTLALIPTKGMTLPFISYGGSSAVSVAIVVGMIIALTRKEPEDYRST